MKLHVFSIKDNTHCEHLIYSGCMCLNLELTSSSKSAGDCTENIETQTGASLLKLHFKAGMTPSRKSRDESAAVSFARRV